MNFSLSEENYLKTIFHLEQHFKEGVSTNAIAEKLETKPSSVTDMVQKLAEKEVIRYVKYKGTTLTEKGRKVAIKIIRKHRLWEVFLVDKLDFQWDEVHEIAEQLEHIASEELINRLDEFLGFPTVDPHGDPIPTKEGLIKNSQKRLLSKLSVGEQGICVGVKDSESEFLKFLDKKNIAIGSQIEVLSKEEFDHSLQINLDGKLLYISKLISDNLYIKLDG
ncbi:MAG: iron-dependent repressor [Flavobacteriaceae bacterium]|nr:iron-dependent repressor [Flavobacteriaceae bacterium]|tara:strand:- start:322 stop:984 length:663 start_codon:yes stop_codon:yes gene_type:complete